jgi:hypothetical protein
MPACSTSVFLLEEKMHGKLVNDGVFVKLGASTAAILPDDTQIIGEILIAEHPSWPVSAEAFIYRENGELVARIIELGEGAHAFKVAGEYNEQKTEELLRYREAFLKS